MYSLVTNSLRNPQLDGSPGESVKSNARSLPIPIVTIPTLGSGGSTPAAAGEYQF
jgi:hypothetical protein